jgi:two-component system, NtrC family, sensor kinase
VTDLKQTAAELAQRLQASLAERSELLLQQAATAEILKVINSSPGSLTPVFDTILEKAHSLCGVSIGSLELFEGDFVRTVAARGFNERWEQWLRQGYKITDLARPIFQAVHHQHIADLRKLSERFPDEPNLRAFVEIGGLRTFLALPLVKDAIVFGRILAARAEVQPFTEKQIALLQTFADQAVIAIQNARLFNETQEALERQTATADILKVIASSPTDVQPVFEAIAERSNRLIGGFSTSVFSIVDDMMHLSAFTRTNPAADAALKTRFPSRLSARPWGEHIRNGEPVLIPDTEAEGAMSSDLRESARMRGYRSMLQVPLLRDRMPIGLISVTRVEPGPFPARHVQLLKTFADQAVIAIENVRLFQEVQAKTRELTEALTYQTGSSNILSVIASSPTDVAPVLKAIAESACELCEAYDAVVRLKAGDELQLRAHHGPIPVDSNKWLISRNWTAGRAVIDKKPVHVHDMLSAEGDEFSEAQEIARQQGHRTVLSVPLLREGESIGAIVLRRIEVHPFSDKQIALLQTFADQAVIAIGNVRMFEQVQQRTKELSQSLDDLRTAQDRLIQTEKLASLGQLTAGIAHEIKNPLNFVNNFSALSAELVGEMKDALSDSNLDKNKRKELDEIAQMLKDNLEKVVQHGKRADSIVKNMLQHSRAGSGEHRPADINAIVDESLNLAYHGARAEKAGFSITLQRDLDPSVGMADVYPQEITRVLLNLISNGFYATTTRKVEAGDGFEPMLSATTKNLGDKVEIRIRDNGTGIPEEIKEKIFNPFFTTKPSGEGTGLGLSMSHDIVVKQHGGTIDVDTESGIFTEFVVTLPRTTIAQKTAGGTD